MIQNNEFLTGAAQNDIPIEIPTMLAGHINRNLPATAILDNPQVNALVIKTHNRQLVLVSIDILEIETEECDS